MYPFSFDEFLQAQGKMAWVDEKRKADSEHPLFEALHKELVRQYRTFLMVGGMPASVVAWLETNDYTQCQAELDDIQLSYYDDFVKYGKKSISSC
jgi:predicted AAA+ superfamily ATPase